MLSRNLEWKNLSEEVSVTHFSSHRHGILHSDQIYLKKIKAKKPGTNPVTLFLLHDLASYHGRFLNFINWFRAQYPNVSFVMMDFLGHGLSSGTRGHIEKFGDLASDVVTAIELIKKEEGEKLIALGHGLGALALLEVGNRFDESIQGKIDGFVVSNFVLNFSSALLSLQNKFLSNTMILERALKTTRPMEIYLPERILTHPKEQALYLEDPLIVRKPTYQTFQCIGDKVKSIYQDAYFLDKPTLLLKSESSYLFSNGMDSFSKGFKKGFLTEKKYPNLKHDLYNERDNLEVFNDIAQWIQS